MRFLLLRLLLGPRGSILPMPGLPSLAELRSFVFFRKHGG